MSRPYAVSGPWITTRTFATRERAIAYAQTRPYAAPYVVTYEGVEVFRSGYYSTNDGRWMAEVRS